MLYFIDGKPLKAGLLLRGSTVFKRMSEYLPRKTSFKLNIIPWCPLICSLSFIQLTDENSHSAQPRFSPIHRLQHPHSQTTKYFRFALQCFIFYPKMPSKKKIASKIGFPNRKTSPHSWPWFGTNWRKTRIPNLHRWRFHSDRPWSCSLTGKN